jgi:hypothetical protein
MHGDLGPGTSAPWFVRHGVALLLLLSREKEGRRGASPGRGFSSRWGSVPSRKVIDNCKWNLG